MSDGGALVRVSVAISDSAWPYLLYTTELGEQALGTGEHEALEDETAARRWQNKASA